MANRVIVFDTSVFIDHLRINKFRDHFLHLVGLVKNSSVVLSELLRGTTRAEEVEFMSALARNPNGEKLGRIRGDSG